MAAMFPLRGSMFFSSFKGCILWWLFVASLVSFIAGNDNGNDNGCDYCYFNPFTHVCCNGECVPGSDCLGHSCTSHTNCAGMESCCANKCKADDHCLGDVCQSNSGCGRYGSCCLIDDRTHDRKCLENCLGAQCISSSDCGRNEYCCSEKCSDSPCSTCARDADCGSNRRCCNGMCREWADECINQTAIFCGAISSIGLLCFLGFLYNRISIRRRLPRHQDETDFSAVGACAAVKSPSPYPEQNLHRSGQTCPDSPPPQYEQQEGIGLQPYHRETTRASDAPPPYSEDAEAISGGAHVAYPSYGAVLTSNV